MAELVFLRRGEEVLSIALNEDRIVLGRSDRCDVSIPDRDVSRQQAALLLDNGKCKLQDLSSRGTLVAGERVTQGEVPDGSDIALGQWRAVFRAHRTGNQRGMTHTSSKTEKVPQADTTANAARIPAQARVCHRENETTVRLQGDIFTIGKDGGNDIVLNHRFVSGRHLKVKRCHNRFHVVDQQSTNGTWLSSIRLFEAEIPFFATLKVGEVEISIEPLATNLTTVGNYHGLMGNDPSIKQLSELIERVASSSATVSIFGESGTGKELVARAVHNCSTRAQAAFIPVNCAAISKELIESELFGHEKGAFTGAATARKGAFEEAAGGTIFLDEIGELPLGLQAKLLRALESGEIKRVGSSRPTIVDVRVVAATNCDLLAATRSGKFREDLYYRLCVIPLNLPPLRNRKGDIVPIAEHFLRLFAPQGQTIRMTDTAKQTLLNHTWPGNVRELRNVVHRGLLLRKGQHLDVGDLFFDTQVDEKTGLDLAAFQSNMTLEQMLHRAERYFIETALRRFNNNRERVARELGMARSTLFKRLKEWGMTQGNDEANV